MNSKADHDFLQRRKEARKHVNALDNQPESVDRDGFFRRVYDQAEADPARVPWADLAPKRELVEWLASHSGNGRKALDVACGLGDNAEAMASAGYETTAFDISQKAIEWAGNRFPDTAVNYQVADLFGPPKGWKGGFDLVHECYTLQALSPQLFETTALAIASLVKPGGRLLVYTRTRADGEPASGPPFPLTDTQTEIFASMGLEMVSCKQFELIRPDKTIPHRFTEWSRSS